MKQLRDSAGRFVSAYSRLAETASRQRAFREAFARVTEAHSYPLIDRDILRKYSNEQALRILKRQPTARRMSQYPLLEIFRGR